MLVDAPEVRCLAHPLSEFMLTVDALCAHLHAMQVSSQPAPAPAPRATQSLDERALVSDREALFSVVEYCIAELKDLDREPTVLLTVSGLQRYACPSPRFAVLIVWLALT